MSIRERLVMQQLMEENNKLRGQVMELERLRAEQFLQQRRQAETLRFLDTCRADLQREERIVRGLPAGSSMHPAVIQFSAHGDAYNMAIYVYNTLTGVNPHG